MEEGEEEEHEPMEEPEVDVVYRFLRMLSEGRVSLVLSHVARAHLQCAQRRITAESYHASEALYRPWRDVLERYENEHSVPRVVKNLSMKKDEGGMRATFAYSGKRFCATKQRGMWALDIIKKA